MQIYMELKHWIYPYPNKIGVKLCVSETIYDCWGEQIVMLLSKFFVTLVAYECKELLVDYERSVSIPRLFAYLMIYDPRKMYITIHCKLFIRDQFMWTQVLFST